MPPTLKLLQKSDIHRDFSLISQLSTERFLFKYQLTSLYMASTSYKFQLNPNRDKDFSLLYAPNN